MIKCKNLFDKMTLCISVANITKEKIAACVEIKCDNKHKIIGFRNGKIDTKTINGFTKGKEYKIISFHSQICKTSIMVKLSIIVDLIKYRNCDDNHKDILSLNCKDTPIS